MPAQAPGFWQSRSLAAILMLPLSGLFWLLARTRRLLFRCGLLAVRRVPVPVVVVGNIAVGGSGKTPVVVWLVSRLREAGFTPGIVSRGYGGRVRGVALVGADDDPVECGDEPVLLAQLACCPVAIGADRAEAASALLAAHPDCDVVVSDDGLQHYRLHRDVEIAVVDEATLGNRWLLPAGPLREGLRRLREVDVVIAHGPLSPSLAAQLHGQPVFPMHLDGAHVRALADPADQRPLADFRGRRVHAIAGIGRPQRFFAQLAAHGLDVVPHAFADHHRFSRTDLDVGPGEPKILTAKDAVKCRSFAPPDTWEFPVTAQIGAGALERIMEKLTHGRPAT